MGDVPRAERDRRPVIVFISVRNVDDMLTQVEWARFVKAAAAEISAVATVLHGAWISYPADEGQSACWCVDLSPGEGAPLLRGILIGLAWQYGQCPIAWAEAPQVECLA
jgi:hypothetical protein